MPPAAEPPATEALPDLASAFDSEMAKGGDYQPPAGQPEYVPKKEPVVEKAPTKEPTKEPVKEASKTEGRKKSALDSAIADEAPVEAKPDELETLLATEDPKKENWVKARETLKRQSEELKTFRDKKPEIPSDVAAEIQAAKQLKAEYEKIKAENAQMRDNIIALDVKYDPAVQSQIASRDKQATSLADRVGEAGGNKEDFLSAMQAPVSKRAKLIDAALEGIDSSRELTNINTRLAQIELLDEQLDEKLSNPHKTFEEMRQQREVQAKEHQEKVEQFKTATFEKIQRELPKLSKLMRMAPADAEGAKEFNEQLQQDIARAPQLLDVAPEEAAVAAYKAARYDSVEKMVVESRAKITELEDELAKYEGSTPSFRGGSKPAPKPDYETPLHEAFSKALGGQAPI